VFYKGKNRKRAYVGAYSQHFPLLRRAVPSEEGKYFVEKFNEEGERKQHRYEISAALPRHDFLPFPSVHTMDG